MPWIITSPPSGSVIEDANGTLWTQVEEGDPGLLFPSGTFTLIGPGEWLVQSEFPQINLGRTVQILAYTSALPLPFVIWEGLEGNLPATIQTLIPFFQLRFRYISQGECYNLSDIAETIPEIDPETEEPVCGTLEYSTLVVNNCNAEGDPPVQFWGVQLTPTVINGYPIQAVRYTTALGTFDADATIVPGAYACGPVAAADQPTMTIVIINAQNEECNIEVGEFAAPSCTECPEADADYELVFIEGVLNLQVNINSSEPYSVGEIQWSINGTPQTPVEVNGIVGGYVLGPVEEGDEIQITYTNSENPECNDVRPLFTVEDPSFQCPDIPGSFALEIPTIGSVGNVVPFCDTEYVSYYNFTTETITTTQLFPQSNLEREGFERTINIPAGPARTLCFYTSDSEGNPVAGKLWQLRISTAVTDLILDKVAADLLVLSIETSQFPNGWTPPAMPELRNFSIIFAPITTFFDLSLTPKIGMNDIATTHAGSEGRLWVQFCNIPTDGVDGILAQLVANGVTADAGDIRLNGFGMGIPSAAGLLDKAILEGRGFAVLVNT